MLEVFFYLYCGGAVALTLVMFNSWATTKSFVSNDFVVILGWPVVLIVQVLVSLRLYFKEQ